MTNLKHMDVEKNFKLLISAVVRMHEVGIRLVNFRISKNDGEPVTLNLDDHFLIIEDEKDRIRIRITDGELTEKVDSLIGRIEKSPTSMYDELLSSKSINKPFEDYSRQLRLYVINQQAFITSSKDTPTKIQLELKEKYDKVIDLITVLREYPETPEKIKAASYYGKNGETTEDRAEKRLKEIVVNKNLELLIATIVKMNREGFVKITFRFNIAESDRNLIVGLDKHSLQFINLTTKDSISLITDNSDDKVVAETMNSIALGPLHKYYDDLVSSRQMRVFLEEFKEYLLTYINSMHRYRVTAPDVTREKISNYDKAYRAVIDFITEYK